MHGARLSQFPRFQPIDRTQVFLRSTDVESLIPEDHPARAIWLFLTRLDLTRFSVDQRAVEGHAGRSAISPCLLLSIWIYSYARGVSSARQISREMEHEPGLQWLSGMEVVNHHTLSDFRIAHGEALQNLMEQVIGVLLSEGLVGLERVTQDGTKIRAQASKRSFADRKRLQHCLDLAKRHMAEVDACNDELSRRERAVRQRIQRERETKLHSALHALNLLENAKPPHSSKLAHVSLSDPDAAFMRHGDGGIAPSYNAQLTTDAAHGLVVGVSVSKASNDAQQLAGAMDCFRQQYGVFPAKVVADGDFTNHASVIAMHERGIEFFGSFGERRLRRPKARGGGTYRAELFTHDAASDQMICPENKRLRFQYFDHQPGRTIRVYIAKKEDCHACPSRLACCGHSELKQTGRKITVSEDQTPVRRFDERMATERGKRIYRQRARLAEFPHAWIKSKCGLRQFRCRTISKVTCEMLFATLTYNLQRYFKLSTA